MNSSDLFYTCSLIEYIGRQTKEKRSYVVEALGKDNITRIYTHADVFHSDVIEKVASEFIEKCSIKNGDFDNVASCKYNVPDYWDIGEVFSRLIEDICKKDEDVIKALIDVYTSWISDAISNYNTDMFYQPRDYIFECYEKGKIVA